MGTRLSIAPATRSDLSGFSQWYEHVAGLVLDEAPDVINTRYVEALDSGILGCALDIDDDREILRAFDRAGAAGPPASTIMRHCMARSVVLAAKTDAETVGVLEMTPPVVPIREMFSLLEQERAGTAKILATHMNLLVRVSKLRLVAVRPDFRGRGIGSELVEHALQIARRSAVKQVFGQFATSSRLAGFYAGHGFKVKDEGVGIRLVGGYEIYSEPTDCLFYKMVQLT